MQSIRPPSVYRIRSGRMDCCLLFSPVLKPGYPCFIIRPWFSILLSIKLKRNTMETAFESLFLPLFFIFSEKNLQIWDNSPIFAP